MHFTYFLKHISFSKHCITAQVMGLLGMGWGKRGGCGEQTLLLECYNNC